MGYVLKPEVMDLPFVEFCKVAEPLVRDLLNEYYETMTDIRRKYRTSFVDVHGLFHYSPSTRLFLRLSSNGVGFDIFYEAHYASGLGYIQQVRLNSLEDIPAELRELYMACENRREAFLNSERATAAKRRDNRVAELSEQVLLCQKEIAKLQSEPVGRDPRIVGI